MKKNKSNNSKNGASLVPKWLRNIFPNDKYLFVALTITVMAIFIGLYAYVIVRTPSLVIPDLTEPTTTDNADKEKSPSTKAEPKTEDEENYEEFQELLKKKVSEPLREGWVSLRKNTLPVFHLTEKSQEQLLNISFTHHPAFLVDENVMNKWPIFNWDFNEIMKQQEVYLEDCRYQLSPVFTLAHERDKGGMLGSSHDQPLMYLNVSMEQFFKATFNEKTYLYWTTELSVLEEKVHQNATKDHYSFLKKTKKNKKQNYQPKAFGWEHLIIREKNLNINTKNKTSNNNDNDNEDEYDLDLWRPMIWLSHPGVISQTHYDTQHNIFIQIQGIKKFYFFEPKEELYYYPNIHRSYRQSQIPLNMERPSKLKNDQGDTERDDDFPLLHPSNASVYEIIVKPGDILYIPPYWPHYVESLSISVSLSILSPSTIEAALSEIYWQKVPFGEFQSTRFYRMEIVKIYFIKLFQFFVYLQENKIQSNRNGKSSPPLTDEEYQHKSEILLKDFTSNLYHTRYQPLETTNPSLFHNLKNLNPEKFCQAELNNQPASISEEEKLSIANELLLRNEMFMKLYSNHSKNIDMTIMKIGLLFKDILELDEKYDLSSSSSDNPIKGTSYEIPYSPRTYFYDITQTFLKDYMEQLVRWAVGREYTGYFIKHCFQM